MLSSVPEPALSRRIHGVILETGTGLPIEQTIIQLYQKPELRVPPPDSWTLVAETVSDAEGRFELVGVFPDRLLLDVRREGRLPWRRALGSAAPVLDLGRIALDPGSTLEGSVIHADGSPLEGGIIRATRLESELSRDAHASLGQGPIPYPIDAHGRFTAETAGIAMKFTIRGSDTSEFVTQWIPLPHEGELTITLPVERSSLYEFRIRDDAGNPVPGARPHSEAGMGSASSADGCCEIRATRDRLRGVRVEHPEHETVDLGSIRAGSGVTEVTLRRARWLLFDLVDEQGRPVHVPMDGSLLDCVDPRPFPSMPVPRGLIRAEGSRYRSHPLPVDTHGGELRIPGFQPHELTWPRGHGPIEFGTIVLRAGPRLVVRVVDPQGEAYDGAEVSLSAAGPATKRTSPFGARLRSQDGGVARASGLPIDRVRIVVDSLEYLPWVGEVELGPDSEVSVDAKLEPGGTLTGLVIGDDGGPLAEAEIHTSPTGKSVPRRSTRTRSDGTFTVTGIPSDVRLILIASAPGRPTLRRHIDPLALRETRALAEPILLPAGARLRGTVRDPSGAPIPRASVCAVSAGHGQSVEADPWGNYRFEGLPAGETRVGGRAIGYVSTEPGELLSIELRAGEEASLDCILAPEVPIEAMVWVHDDTGAPVPHAEVRLRGDHGIPRALATTDREGRVRLRSRGPVQALVVRAEDYFEHREAWGPGPTLEPRIVSLRSHATVVARISTGDGREYGGAAELRRARAHGIEKIAAIRAGGACFEELPPGSYWLSLRGEENPVRRYVVARPRQSTVVRLELP